ncbi:MAG: hypothetical protein ACYCQK_01965 [Acidiferrobacteraceae bacterium]
MGVERVVTFVVVTLACVCFAVGGPTGEIVLGAAALALGFCLAGMTAATLRRDRRSRLTERSQLTVRIGQSRGEGGKPVPHEVSVWIEDARGAVLTFEGGFDLREPDVEEKVAVSVATLKQHLWMIEAAQRIAVEP